MSWPSSSKAAKAQACTTATRVQKQLQRRHLHHGQSMNLKAHLGPFNQKLVYTTILHCRRMRYSAERPISKRFEDFPWLAHTPPFFRPRRHAFAHGHRRVHEALLRARRVRCGKRARLDMCLGAVMAGVKAMAKSDGSATNHDVLGSVHEGDRS